MLALNWIGVEITPIQLVLVDAVLVPVVYLAQH
jgi:hypothetical protein